MARLLRFAIAAAASAAILLLLTFGAYQLHLWVGDHASVRDFTLRTLEFLPVVVGLVASIWPLPRLSRSPFAAGLIGAIIGFVYGYGVTRMEIALFEGRWRWEYLGPYYSDWEIELAVSVCAVVAGTCAMLLAVTARSRRVIAAVVSLISAALLVPAPAFDFIAHNQELTIAVLIPYTAGGANEPAVDSDTPSHPVDVGSVTKHIQGLLRDQGITGHYQVSHLWRGGHGKQALAVIVFNQPVISWAELQQPFNSELIYLQQANGWRKIPPQVPTLSRVLMVGPALREDEFGFLHIHDVGGFGPIWPILKTND